MKRYNKLVRDLIPQRMDGKGLKYSVHQAGPEEYAEKLREKLQEEVTEYLKDLNAEELADILEVVYALGNLHNASQSELENIRIKKVKERGAFEKRIILDEGE